MKKIRIKKMPSKRMLEKFLQGMGGLISHVEVYFDKEKGIFKKNGSYDTKQ